MAVTIIEPVKPVQLCKRKVPMKVLALGLSRTGTDSLRKALQQLGFQDTYHGYAATLERPQDSKVWLDAIAAKFDGKGKPFGREEFDILLGDCQAVTDVPAACFAEELIKAYPEAKVILTNRDVNDWYRSIVNGALPACYNKRARMGEFLARLTRSPMRWTRPMVCAVWEKYYGGFEENGKTVYHAHYKKVRDLVPPERLLEYRVQDGWGPLCNFLSQPVPKDPFPNGNDRAETYKKVRGAILYEVERFVIFLLVVGPTIAYLLQVLQQMEREKSIITDVSEQTTYYNAT